MKFSNKPGDSPLEKIISDTVVVSVIHGKPHLEDFTYTLQQSIQRKQIQRKL